MACRQARMSLLAAKSAEEGLTRSGIVDAAHFLRVVVSRIDRCGKGDIA